MAASRPAPGRTTITKLPGILDVDVMGGLLEELGCAVEIDHAEERVTIACPSS